MNLPAEIWYTGPGTGTPDQTAGGHPGCRFCRPVARRFRFSMPTRTGGRKRVMDGIGPCKADILGTAKAINTGSMASGQHCRHPKSCENRLHLRSTPPEHGAPGRRQISCGAVPTGLRQLPDPPTRRRPKRSVAVLPPHGHHIQGSRPPLIPRQKLPPMADAPVIRPDRPQNATAAAPKRSTSRPAGAPASAETAGPTDITRPV